MQELTISPVFNITRLAPKKAEHILRKVRSKKFLKNTRGYRMTSDEQRYSLIHQIINNEMALKDVKETF
jgi:hypothetical protein